MSNEMRISKFETLIIDIDKALKRNFNLPEPAAMARRLYEFNQKSLDTIYTKQLNTSLTLIFDYDSLNDFGKVIMTNSSILISESKIPYKEIWSNKYLNKDFKDISTKIEATKEFIKHCRTDNNRQEAYKFIFWAMMILTVDDTNKEEHLSLICDFARMLKISDEEMQDILTVIKVIYQKEDENLIVLTTTISDYFEEIL